MAEQVIVEVTAGQLRVGLRRDPSECPVAVALRAAGFPGARVYHHLVAAARAGAPPSTLWNGPGLKRYLAAIDDGRDALPVRLILDWEHRTIEMMEEPGESKAP